jgi:hypothetical protein
LNTLCSIVILRLYPVEKTFVCIQFAIRNPEKIGPYIAISSGGDSGCWYVAISIKLIAHISLSSTYCVSLSSMSVPSTE